MKKTFLLIGTSLLLLVACNSDKKDEKESDKKMDNSAEAKEEKNKQTALASVNALIAGDVDGTLKDVVTDAVDYGDGSMSPVKGVDSIKAGLHMWRDNMSTYKADNMLAMADGDYVAVFGEWSATFKADMMGMKMGGKSVKIKDVDIFKFNSEGKIIEHRNVQSSAEMMKQLGVEMPK
ncbi:MAG: ester cyclase [Chitinophagaceae bacterium]